MMRASLNLKVGKVLFWWCWLVLPLSQAWGQSAILHLRNGDRLTGTILREETNQIIFKTAWWNVVVVPQSEIKSREPFLAEKQAPPAIAGQLAQPALPVSPSAALAKAAVAPPRTPAKPKVLTGEAQAGLDLLFSERERQLYSGRLKTTYTQAPFRVLLDYHAAYGRTDGLLSDNNMFGSLKTDWDLGRRLYLYNLAGAGYDAVQKIDLKYEVGPGVGWHVFALTNFAFNTELGANYQAQYRSDHTRTESVYLRVAEDAAWKITPRISLDEKIEFFPRVEGGFDQYRFRLESNLRYALLNNVSLIVTVLDQYDTTPAKGVPQNSLQLTSSLGVKF